MSSTSIVRPALPDDEKSLWTLFRLLHEENGVFPMSESKLDWLLHRLLHPELIAPDDMGLRGYLGVIGPSHELEAFIMLILGSYWYTDEYHLEEFATFVHPKHRKSKHARALLAYSKNMSDKIGIPLLIGIISNHKTEAKVRLYRQHLPEAGAFFLYNGHTGAETRH